MVRMARLGLAMAQTLALKVQTNFRLAIPTVYEGTNMREFQQKVNY